MTGVVILLCVLSRAIAVPMYLRQLGWITMNPSWDSYFNTVSKFFLFAAGISGTVIIFYYVIKAYRQRRTVRATLMAEVKVA